MRDPRAAAGPRPPRGPPPADRIREQVRAWGRVPPVEFDHHRGGRGFPQFLERVECPPFLWREDLDCFTAVNALSWQLSAGELAACARACDVAAVCPGIGPGAAGLLETEAALFRQAAHQQLGRSLVGGRPRP